MRELNLLTKSNAHEKSSNAMSKEKRVVSWICARMDAEKVDLAGNFQPSVMVRSHPPPVSELALAACRQHRPHCKK